MSRAWYTTVKKHKHTQLRTRHMRGLPPEVTGGVDKRTLLPWPEVIIMMEKDDGIVLDRYTGTGEFGGNTWHQTIEGAKHQAAFEYEDLLGEWIPISDEVTDPKSYAINSIK